MYKIDAVMLQYMLANLWGKATTRNSTVQQNKGPSASQNSLTWCLVQKLDTAYQEQN